ncbi:anchored repeat-type ABC transporter permease subunit [Actinomyces sp. zg-332]|uniref:anchored repeat-type ABC transporter permease subunit n=1 Tax=Actinomyces sp. zg-332 TaxID=2708340 RepID=UPI0018E07D79|nr:anchored repeat-type ABC transporter permease subunit [Actinomyces sp. zg-332]QPK93802.1 anchored repeat-type ABC transporter permease subunit [Actinomyces sp. zg-332]
MISFIDFLQDLCNPILSFLPKALLAAVIASVVCGVVGNHVVLRGMSFIGDAVAHSVFPGIAFAFLLQGSLVLGGAIAGVVTAVLVATFTQNRRLKEDSVIGVFFAGAFALGILVISLVPGYSGSLQQFLFGSIVGISNSDLYISSVVGLIILFVCFLLHKEFTAVNLDRETAKILGIRVFVLDVVLYVMVTFAVVISIQTIGNVLVLALLVTPAATARLLTDKMSVMMILSPMIGIVSAFIGVYLSWSLGVPTGATIVLVATLCFLLTWVFAPKHGLIRKVFVTN